MTNATDIPAKGGRVTRQGRLGTCTALGDKTMTIKWDDGTSNLFRLNDPERPVALVARPAPTPTPTPTRLAPNTPHPSGLNRKQRRDAFRNERKVTRALTRRVFEGRKTAALGEYKARVAAIRESDDVDRATAHVMVLAQAHRKIAALEPMSKLLKRLQATMRARTTAALAQQANKPPNALAQASLAGGDQ